MTKVESMAALRAMKERLRADLSLREKAEHPEALVQIKVAMGTCGIAAGAKEVMTYMMNKADELGLEIVFTQTGCMGHCHAEPTVQVEMPDCDPVMFGKVDSKKADEILIDYVRDGKKVEGIIPLH